jgi:hypothetical protein
MALHQNSNENNKHTPKGFTSAPNMGKILRDENGLSTYVPETTLPASLNFVNGAVAPPTEVLNQVYVIVDTGGGTIHPNWDGLVYNNWCRFDGASWIGYTPVNGDICYDSTALKYKIFQTTAWVDFGVSGGGGGGDTIYAADGTIGSSRVATITDSLEFAGGRVDLSSITDGFLLPRLTAAQRDAVNTPTTNLIILNTDTNSFEKYNGSVWVYANLPKYIVKSGGINKPYSSFKSAIDSAISGSVIEVNISESVDLGIPSAHWTWSANITINMNGHALEVTNLRAIKIADSLVISIIGGGSIDVQSTISSAGFDFQGDATFSSDKTVNIFQTVGGNGAFNIGNFSTKTVTLNGILSYGNPAFCIRAGGLTKCIVNDSHLTNLGAGNFGCIDNDNFVVNNTILIGKGTGTLGNTGIDSLTNIFNNCTFIGKGLKNLGNKSIILNNCTVSNENQTISAGGGQIKANNCDFKTIGSTSFLITVLFNNSEFNNSTFEADLNVILTNINININNCTMKSFNGYAIQRTTSTGTNPVIIKNSILESTGNDVIYFSSANQGLGFDLSNVTLISNTGTQYCLNLNAGSTARYDNMKFKNTVTAANQFSRSSIPTDNLALQTSTIDTLGNITLD